MPVLKPKNPLVGESLPDHLPPNQAEDEELIRRGEKLDKACRVYKGTLSVDRIPVGSTEPNAYEQWFWDEYNDLT